MQAPFGASRVQAHHAAARQKMEFQRTGRASECPGISNPISETQGVTQPSLFQNILEAKWDKHQTAIDHGCRKNPAPKSKVTRADQVAAKKISP